MALFGIGRKESKPPKLDPNAPPSDPRWARNQRAKFHRLIHLDIDAQALRGQSAVYVIWHSGVAPRWVWVDRTDDLGQTLADIQFEDDVMFYEKHGGLYVTWAPIRREFQAGVVRYLHDQMKPEIDNPDVRDIADPPVPVLVPGARTPASPRQAPD